MHIAFCLDDAYVPYVTVTMKSIIVNHLYDEIYFYILTDYISEKNVKLLNEVVKGIDNVSYEMLYVEDNRVEALKKGSWTKYTWYRIFLPTLLPKNVRTVLYLDVDTLVVGDIKELFKLDIKDIAIAGCIDPQNYKQETFIRCGYDSQKRYVCAGVLLMNLDYWRKTDLTETLIKFAIDNNKTIMFPDQDSINCVCQDSKIVLPLKYGVMDWFFQNDQYNRSELSEELQESILHPAIIHYAANLPWIKEFDNRLFHDEWRRYNKMLKHPAKRTYNTKGWNFVKMIVWNILHQTKRRQQTKEEAIKKIYDS